MPSRDFMDRHRSLRILIDLLIVIASFYIITVVWNVLTNFGDILLLFFLAWVITFILEPVSSFLVGKRVLGRPIPRVVAVSLVYLALLVVISGLIVLAVPAIQAQITQVATLIQVDLSASHLRQMSSSLVGILERLGFSATDANNLVNQLVAQLPTRIHDITNQAISSASTLLSTVTTLIFDGSLVVILSFYMMLDGGRLIEALVLKLPPSWEPDLRLFQTYINDMFAGFFRAQLIVAGLYAVATWGIMLILGDGSGAFLAAFLAGIFMLLPFVGAFLAVVPPALLVVLQTPPNQLVIKLLIMVVLLGAAQHVVLNLLAPRIYGQHLGIDPILLFGALLLGGQVGGVWGSLFAAPVVAIIYAIFETFYDRLASTHPLFQPEESAADAVEGIAPPILPGNISGEPPPTRTPQPASPASPNRSVPGMSGIYRISGLTTRGANGANGTNGAGKATANGQPSGNGASNGSTGTGGTGGTRAAPPTTARTAPFGRIVPGLRDVAASNPPAVSGASGAPDGTDGASAAPSSRRQVTPTNATPAAEGPICEQQLEAAADEMATGQRNTATPLAPDETTTQETIEAASNTESDAETHEGADQRESSGILPFPWRHPHPPRRRAHKAH